MAPNLEENLLNRVSKELILFMLPHGPISDDSEEDIDPDIEDSLTSDPSQIHVPLEHNLRALLVQVTGTENLELVTQVKLRVIARDVPLQHLGVFIPALRELILDGSVVATLRELGSGLKNLKILRINRCGIEVLDNMLALESLEELYAADNLIENCMPCAFLSNLKVLDLRRNRLKDVRRTLTFLTICEKLEHIFLEGNDEIWQFGNYRQTVKSLLPTLRSLNGITFEDESNPKLSQQNSIQKAEKVNQNTVFVPIKNGIMTRSRPTSDTTTGFTITFPPKVFNERPPNFK
ncbi:leucine-rich repeat-containing protein 56 [Tribolium madens]|uniref:leucine-rich repeat-containing protein 56 n=1 Tax=Tribolium madens TaxID=41895 RepID=UPI001CF758CC|nr:leucine-rich repeat-containing protein 56 [Tribolium madens]